MEHKRSNIKLLSLTDVQNTKITTIPRSSDLCCDPIILLHNSDEMRSEGFAWLIPILNVKTRRSKISFLFPPHQSKKLETSWVTTHTRSVLNIPSKRVKPLRLGVLNLFVTERSKPFRAGAC